MRASRILGLALVVAAASLLATTPSQANCSGSAQLFQGFGPGGYFSNCGTDQALMFYWEHHFAVQRLGGANAGTTGAAGNDSGAISSVTDAAIQACDDVSCPAGPGNYICNWDWFNFGSDGCILNKLESDISCNTGTTPSLPVQDLVFAGTDLLKSCYGGSAAGTVCTTSATCTGGGICIANRLQAKAAVVSIDGNEVFQFWVYDQAGATSVDGLPCGQDANQFIQSPPTCGAIPIPIVTGSVCDTTGCTLTLSVGPHAVPILDDCAVANSKAIDCPRNLYAGRQIFIKRAPCNATSDATVGTFDNRAFAMDVNAGTIARNFVPYSPQDANLNGIIDGTETGPLTFVKDTGNATWAPTVRITKNASATDCAYLGVALVLDASPDATSCTGSGSGAGNACESPVAPLIAVDPVPISLDNATPASDRVLNLVASKTAGKANVAWDTTAELQTAGFNLIGTKKGGGTVQLNSSLIQAKQGTTGQGATYSINLTAGDLKGSSAVYVELVKNDGAKERFGPASF